MRQDPSTLNKILQVKNLKANFKTESSVIKAVDNISFDVTKGEVLGIVGESGSGKSVTCLSIMQLINKAEAIVEGDVIFNSSSGATDLNKLSEKDLTKLRGKEVSMIFQEPSSALNPVLTCGYQVSEAIKAHQKSKSIKIKEKVLTLFEQVQLLEPESIYNAYPHQLSGGQKQRVMIAMALSCSPSLIIADEPTTALDVTVQASILKLLKELKQEQQLSLIFISHDHGVIAEIADKVIVMYKGQIVESGKIAEVFFSPKHPYTKGLLACRPPVDVKLKVLPTISDFMDTDEQGNIIEKKNNFLPINNANSENKISPEEQSSRQKLLEAKTPLLEVQNLKTYYGSKNKWFKIKAPLKAVDNISFSVYTGETLGLVGESGCGKSTLARSILKLVEPDEGKIIFNGINITSLNHNELRDIRKDIQMVFQDPFSSLNPLMTIGNAIMEPLQVHHIGKDNKGRKRMVLDMLNKVNLDSSFFNRYPRELSGGQRQRASIARAMVVNPKLIIFDEAVSALDVSIQAQVLNLINSLKKEYNFTCIFISHDLSVIQFISDRILVMKQGKIIESGYPKDIFDKPIEDYTKRLINAIPKGLNKEKEIMDNMNVSIEKTNENE